jgi:hypothetical protein
VSFRRRVPRLKIARRSLRRFLGSCAEVEPGKSGIQRCALATARHLRQWVRPLRGVVCGYLDDLFVEPACRGSGMVDALFAEINRIARDRDWAVVRWTTTDDNYRARSVYDRVAGRTTWITYDMTPSNR